MSLRMSIQARRKYIRLAGSFVSWVSDDASRCNLVCGLHCNVRLVDTSHVSAKTSERALQYFSPFIEPTRSNNVIG